MDVGLFEGVGLGGFEGVRCHNLRGFVVQGLTGLVFRGSGPPGRFFSLGKFLGSFDVQGTQNSKELNNSFYETIWQFLEEILPSNREWGGQFYACIVV